MSVFSVSALDRLIEPSSRDDSSSSTSNEKGLVRERRPVYTYSAYSPAAIASNPQRSPSPSSYSSPFIVNFKGRRAVRQETQKPFVEDHVSKSMSLSREDTESELVNRKPKVTPLKASSQEENSNSGNLKALDAFTKFPDCILSASSENMHNHSSPGNSSNREGCLSFGGKTPFDDSLQAPRNEEGESDCSASGDEFFDAPESPTYGDELLYDGKLSSKVSGNLSNLDVLEAEVEQCVSAQKALLTAREQHDAVLGKLFLSGSSMPSHDQVSGRSCTDLSYLPEHISQRLEVARLVACAVARGAAKAEAEEELAMTLNIKNREISRLRDKLHYYETINHEMSQRNQECVEIARRQRRERRRKLRLTIGCIAVTACLSMSAAALYRYFPWQDLKARMSYNSIELGADIIGDDVGQKI